MIESKRVKIYPANKEQMEKLKFDSTYKLYYYIRIRVLSWTQN